MLNKSFMVHTGWNCKVLGNNSALWLPQRKWCFTFCDEWHLSFSQNLSLAPPADMQTMSMKLSKWGTTGWLSSGWNHTLKLETEIRVKSFVCRKEAAIYPPTVQMLNATQFRGEFCSLHHLSVPGGGSCLDSSTRERGNHWKL